MEITRKYVRSLVPEFVKFGLIDGSAVVGEGELEKDRHHLHFNGFCRLRLFPCFVVSGLFVGGLAVGGGRVYEGTLDRRENGKLAPHFTLFELAAPCRPFGHRMLFFWATCALMGWWAGLMSVAPTISGGVRVRYQFYSPTPILRPLFNHRLSASLQKYTKEGAIWSCIWVCFLFH